MDYINYALSKKYVAAATAEQAAQINKNVSDIGELKDDLSDKLPKSPANWEPWSYEERKAARERIGIGGYEFIEKIELEEETNVIIRNAWPDGTPYRFSKIILYMYNPDGFPAGGVTRVDYFLLNHVTELITYAAYGKYVTHEIESGVGTIKYLTFGTDYDYAADFKKGAFRIAKTGLEEFIPISEIRVLISNSSITMPVGTTVSLYGVRA